jgi:putative IMPACT (imprinted ancient) family translation regulator
VKASRFLAVAAPAGSEDEARMLLGEIQRAAFDATHHCSAWRIHGGAWRANDAGEPSGSAGAPILAAIDGAALADCAVIVTRYYGGTKLGVGGLVRAYGEAAALALDAAPRRLATPAVRIQVRFDHDRTSIVMRVIERLGAREVEHGYSAADARPEVSFTLPTADEPALHELLREWSGGNVAAEVLGPRLLHSTAGPTLA